MAISYSGADGRDSNAETSQFDAPASPSKVGQFEKNGQLDLGDDDVRLPWLEGDDDEELNQGGVSSGQLIAFIVLGIVALGLIVGGIWWLQREKPDAALVADGEIIEAPTAPYKTKPANPGGAVVAGTGDTSYAVAEGQTRQVRIGGEAVPAPAAPASTAAVPASGGAGTAATANAPAQAAADVSGVGVQIGAYSNRESAEKGWTTLTQQHEVLSGMRHRIVEGRADIGTVYRLQAVPGDGAAATRLCTTLKAAGLNCQVKR